VALILLESQVFLYLEEEDEALFLKELVEEL